MENSDGNNFYVYVQSDADTEGIYPENRGGNFTIPLYDSTFLDHTQWEVGLSEISFPNTFHNIHGDMTKVTLGNRSSFLDIRIPSGRYSPQGFVNTLNIIVSELQLISKHHPAPGVPYQVRPKGFQEIKMRRRHQLDISSTGRENYEEQAEFQLQENIEDESEGRIIVGPRSRNSRPHGRELSVEEREHLHKVTKKFLRKLRRGENPFHDRHPPDAEEVPGGDVSNTDLSIADVRDILSGEAHITQAIDYYKTSKLFFFYDEDEKKIGVKPFFKDNPFGDYVVFHDARLRAIMGMTDKDAEKISDNNNHLKRNNKRVFTYQNNFNMFTHNIYVYCDMASESRLGNIKANILDILCIPEKKSNNSNALVFKYEKPHYHRLSQNTLQKISIFLADDLGKEIIFYDHGRVLVALHFRKIKR